MRFVGVTIITGSPEQGGDFSRWRVGAEQIVAGRDVGIGRPMFVNCSSANTAARITKVHFKRFFTIIRG